MRLSADLTVACLDDPATTPESPEPLARTCFRSGLRKISVASAASFKTTACMARPNAASSAGMNSRSTFKFATSAPAIAGWIRSGSFKPFQHGLRTCSSPSPSSSSGAGLRGAPVFRRSTDRLAQSLSQLGETRCCCCCCSSACLQLCRSSSSDLLLLLSIAAWHGRAWLCRRHCDLACSFITWFSSEIRAAVASRRAATPVTSF